MPSSASETALSAALTLDIPMETAHNNTKKINSILFIFKITRP